MKGIRIIIQTLEDQPFADGQPTVLASYREILTDDLLARRVGIKTSLKIIADDLVEKFTNDIIMLGKFDDKIT